MLHGNTATEENKAGKRPENLGEKGVKLKKKGVCMWGEVSRLVSLK